MKGNVLGDYNLIKQLGAGSLGNVHLAEHRFTKQKVALKVLPEELSSDRGFIQRFEEDVKTLSGLTHPNIVKIHNVSFSAGNYFLVTDCIVDGLGETTTLGQYVQGRKLSEEEILRLLRGVAEALDWAHDPSNGKPSIVHRGLKLSNILVGQGQLLLSDFGLSRIAGTGYVLSRTYRSLVDSLSDRQTEASKTLQNSFLQTFAFLAPEQKRADRIHEVGVKTDTWAFGILVYFLLMRHWPEGAFEMPSSKEFKLDWDKLIRACLSPDPEKRPAQLLPLLDALVAPEKPPAATVVPEAVEAAPPISVNQAIEQRMRSEWTVTSYKPQSQESLKVEPLLSEMVVIPGGHYMRGSNSGSRDEMPRHRVQVSRFALDIHPVTNEQFIRFLEHIGGEKDDNNHDIIRLKESRIRRVSGKPIVEPGYSKHPVIGVSWYGALAYANWIGRRLPTEAEWEIAASTGRDAHLYPTGDEIEKSMANFFSSDTTAVMSYAPNEFGLYDMAGNVYEWCHDWYEYNYYEHSAQESNQPKGPLHGVYRVLRGGCWKSLKEDLRCSHRHRNNPGTINRTYGFRCAADV